MHWIRRGVLAWAGGAVCGLHWCAPALMAAPAQGPTPVEKTGGERVGVLLLGGRLGRLPAERVQVELETVDLGVLYSTLRRGRFSARVGENGASSWALESRERTWLQQALLTHPWPDVQRHLDGRLEAGPAAQETMVVLGVLGAALQGHELEELARWTDPEPGQARVDAGIRRAYGDALSAIFDRSTRSIALVPRLMERAHLSLLSETLDALVEHGTSESLGALVGLLGSSDQVNALVLVEIGELSRLLPRPVNEASCARVRGLMEDSKGVVLLEAILAVQHMDDRDSVGWLIELLGHKNAAVRARAHAALRSITGQAFSASVESWAEWHSRTLEWWKEGAQEQLGALVETETASRSRILLDLSKRRFHRHRIAERIAPLLEDDDRRLAATTCAVLGHLGSTVAVPPLIDALAGSDAELKRAAYLALCRITGVDHGEDPNAWDEADGPTARPNRAGRR